MKYGRRSHCIRRWVKTAILNSATLSKTDAIPPEAVGVLSLLVEQFKQVLETLSPREAGVIRMRYGLGRRQPKTLDIRARSLALPVKGYGR